MSFYQDNHITIHNQNFRQNDLPDESVQCVVTSPPYWGLRKYSGEQELIWGGDRDCEHNWVDDPIPGEKSGPPGPNATVGARFAQDAVRHRKPTNTCSLCAAWKGAYGLEPTPEMYIEHTIEILREIRRVLRKDGVVFLNIGDSYMSSPSNQQGRGVGKSDAGARGAFENIGRQKRIPTASIKPKDLCLIPFRLAIAAQEDGWWVRSVIIWSKPNPMPESVTDRPTESHEYILLLAKGQSSVTTIKFSQLSNKATELGNNRLFKNSRMRDITRLCVNLATSILNSPYFQEDLCLLLLNPEIRQEYSQAISGGLVGDLPSKHLVLSNVARFLHGDITTENFLKEFYGTIMNLSNSDIFLITGGLPFVGDTPSVYSDGNGAITIQHAGEICKFDFIHNLIIAQKPTTCKYYWDADAVREPPSESTLYRAGWPNEERPNGKRGKGDGRGMVVDGSYVPPSGRNIRTVWEFPTQPYPEAHFAVFPEKLPEICIKAATPEVGCCSKCGAPWERVIKGGFTDHNGETKSQYPEGTTARRLALLRQAAREKSGEYVNQRETLGWQPTCKCNADKVPSVVLDPFAGAGTTLWVAKKLNRKAVGYEISQEYCDLALERNRQQVMV